MKQIKISLSLIVMLLVSGGAAWAVVQNINGFDGNQTLVSNFDNISVVSSSSALSHTLKWNGALPVSRGGTGMQSFTNGSVLFYDSGASLSQSNANLFWSVANSRLGVGTNMPSSRVEVNGTLEATQISTNSIVASGSNQSLSLNPTGTGKVLVRGDSIVVSSKSDDPTDNPKAGQIYFNTTTNKFRGYNGTEWVTFISEAEGNQSIDLESDGSQNLSISDGAQTGLDFTSSLTLEGWVKPETQPNTNTIRIFAAKQNNTTSEGYYFGYRDEAGTPKLHFYVSANSNGTVADSYKINQTLNSNTWYHVAVTWNGSNKTAKFYVDGTQVGGDQVGTNVSTINNSTAPFKVGADDANYWDGLIDDVRAWNVARTQTEINNNKSIEIDSATNLQGSWHLSGNIEDLSGNNNDLTNNGSAIFSPESAF